MDTLTQSAIEARAIHILKLAVGRTADVEALQLETAELQALLAEVARHQRINRASGRGIVVPLTR